MFINRIAAALVAATLIGSFVTAGAAEAHSCYENSSYGGGYGGGYGNGYGGGYGSYGYHYYHR
jgi:hypothetical protein